jgi:Xaa-Pro aminopeptidase
MQTSREKLLDAQRKAEALFQTAEEKGFLVPGQTEKELNTRIYQLAEELFGIRKYWHKRIVRAGKNTLAPYDDNPPDLLIGSDDILFFDFGPVFEDWEADLGRTYVIGTDPIKLKLAADIEDAWHKGRDYYHKNPGMTGAAFYAWSVDLAKSYGWEFGGPIAGHIIGNFPHKEILGSEVQNYILPENDQPLSAPDILGQPRHWIYEIHFVDRNREIGGFFEQLL